MRELVRDMMTFHNAILCGDLPAVGIPSKKVIKLRKTLIKEECVKELLVALEDLEIALERGASESEQRMILVRIADGIIDTIVVVVGTALAFGMGALLPKLWDEVWRSNMAKASGPVRFDGKRLKPEGWQPPRIYDILFGKSLKLRVAQ